MRFIYFTALIFIVTPAFSQKKKEKEPAASFNKEIFESNLATAKWLNEYELVATLTADTIMNSATGDEPDRLGKDWFCFTDEEGLWHAVYGKYYLGEFDQVFHLTVDTEHKIRRTREKVDTARANSYARALRTAATVFRELDDSSGLYFNRYIRRESDGIFRVFMLPVLQPNGNSVFGRSYTFFIEDSGIGLREMQHTSKERIITYNVNVPSEIWVNNLKRDEPTVPALFFAWYYRAYFKKIHIESRNMISSLAKDPFGNYTWVHVVPPAEPKKKKNK